MRIVQISDTHHSVSHRHFVANTDLIARSLAQTCPDLFIHTGDLSMDGAQDPDDLRLARQWNDKLPGEVLSIPGNHDVGDLPSNRPDQPVTDARLSSWRSIIGPDRWLRSYADWHIIGLNAMLLGTGHREEEEQFAWLASVVRTDRKIALFTHKPLCIETLSEGPRGYWTIPPQPRARLLDVLAGKSLKLIASGHLHIQHQQAIDGVQHVWGPASSFVVGDSQEDLGGERCLGIVEHIFSGDTVTSRFMRADGLKDLLLDPVRGDIYPN